MFLSDKSGIQRASPISPARVHLSGHEPVDMPEKFTVGLDSTLSESEATRNDAALPIWGVGEIADLIILERAHPVYAQRIELDRTVLASLKIGDGFSMRIPQTARKLKAIVIDRVHNQHSETIVASVSAAEGTFAVQFTVSGESVFGNIETPEGVFVLEQQANFLEGSAVIFSEKEIYQNLDYRESDAIPLE